mmetsp:Transcript_133428/g.231860  ORF Transcript_133428/g.231860 Transcript_133428/m.231860 type:complete len:311 (+) Transcript_133428:44-976(+)
MNGPVSAGAPDPAEAGGRPSASDSSVVLPLPSSAGQGSSMSSSRISTSSASPSTASPDAVGVDTLRGAFGGSDEAVARAAARWRRAANSSESSLSATSAEEEIGCGCAAGTGVSTSGAPATAATSLVGFKRSAVVGGAGCGCTCSSFNAESAAEPPFRPPFAAESELDVSESDEESELSEELPAFARRCVPAGGSGFFRSARRLSERSSEDVSFSVYSSFLNGHPPVKSSSGPSSLGCCVSTGAALAALASEAASAGSAFPDAGAAAGGGVGAAGAGADGAETDGSFSAASSVLPRSICGVSPYFWHTCV